MKGGQEVVKGACCSMATGSEEARSDSGPRLLGLCSFSNTGNLGWECLGQRDDWGGVDEKNLETACRHGKKQARCSNRGRTTRKVL